MIAGQVPLLEDGGIDAFRRREVLPHAADAWYDPESVKTGYKVILGRITPSATQHASNDRYGTR